MSRTPRRPLVLVVAASLMALATAAPAQAANIKITGKLKGSYVSQVGKIILLTADGRAIQGTIASNKTFTIKTTAAKAKNGSLQLIGTNNRYFGPVVLKTDKFKKRGKSARYFNHMTLSGKTLALGNVTVYNGWAKGVGNSSGYSKAFISALNSKGQPAGAGKAGKVVSSRPSTPKGYKPSGVKVAAPSGAVAFANTTDLLASTSTGDPDGDGIPNALDIADSTTGMLDIVNPDLGQRDALIPWSDMQLGVGTAINVHTAGVTRDDVANLIGGTGNFNVVFFLSQASINGSNDYRSLNYAYVDCGALVYCANSVSATAYNAWSPGDVTWRTQTGFSYAESGLDTATLTDLPANTGAPFNPLVRMLRNDTNCFNGLCPYWTAGMQPRTGADTLSVLKPGDIYTVHGVSGGTDTAVPMMLSPFAATVPMVASTLPTTNGTYLDANGKLTVGEDGHITFDYYRPQRLTVAGETGDFMDLGGMHYGFTLGLEGKNEFGCAPEFYNTTTSGLSQNASYNPNNISDNLWPLRDNVTTDLNPATSTPLTIDLDFNGCIQAIVNDDADYHEWGEKVTADRPLSEGETAVKLRDITGVSLDTPLTYQMALTAAGEFVTGGANRAALSMQLENYTVSSAT